MDKAIKYIEKLEIWIFYSFLIVFTLSIRKVLFFYPIKGTFNEFAGGYLYLSDIFLLLLLLASGISILYNKLSIKSSNNISSSAYIKQKFVIIPLLLVIFSFISGIWSGNKSIAIFRSIKLLEFYLLYLWVAFRMFHPRNYVPRGTLCRTSMEQLLCYFSKMECSTWNIIRNSMLIVALTGVIQSIIGIWQFIIQKSAGLHWLGESIISPTMTGVAKVVFDNEKYVRAYGLFPHPNILGGFLILSILVTILVSRMFHVEHSDKLNGANKCSTWNIYAKWKVCLLLGIQIVGLILTFSKSAWLGLGVAFIYLWWFNVPRGTSWFAKIKNMFHVEHIKYYALIGAAIILIILVTRPDTHSFWRKSIEDRLFYLDVSRGTLLEHPVLGVGSGQFVLDMENLKNIEIWQYQPVHNVFLLVLNELGSMGLILFVWFLLSIFRNDVPRGTSDSESQILDKFENGSTECSTWNIPGRFLTQKTFIGICFGFVAIIFFDHYLWDIQQGQIILWMVMGVIIGNKLWITPEIQNLSTEKSGC